MPCPRKSKKARYKQCVRKVRRKGTARSPHAVCRKAIYGKKKK